MNKRRSVHTVKLLSFLSGLAFVLIGCSQSLHDMQAEPAKAGTLEQVVVTASRAMSANTGFLHSFADIATDALALVAPGEEVWVIAKPATEVQSDDQVPGSGAMVAKLPGEQDTPKDVPLPLEHTSVNASINGYISTVDVRQRFGNPFSEKIEAVYMFPLPQDAAVSEFVMVIGERRIRGILREKEEAEAIYAEARSRGYQASLLLQHRPNIFEQKVANIEPGKTIEVDIRYFNTLAYNDGWYSFVFPTVVGPRFNPPGSTDPIGAVSRDKSKRGLPGKNVSYLRPNERSAHDIDITVDVQAGVPVEDLNASHEILTTESQFGSTVVTLKNKDTIPNKDFILNFRVAGDTIKSKLLTWVDPATNQGYFTMMMYPPAGIERLERRPVEIVFVLDCSGSMNGRPIEQAKGAVSAALGMLQENDTFQIIRFSDNASQFGSAPVQATAENIALARDYLRRLHGSGGTMMIEGVKTALNFPHDPERLRFVSFMTDGYIGNEVDIIAAVHNNIGASRIFSFGVGSSVNRYLLERMAKEGRGVVAYLGPKDSGRDIMSALFKRISHPAMTDLSIDWGNMSVSDVYPSKVPDMFVGRPVFITGRFLGEPDTVNVTGRVAGQTRMFAVDAADSAERNQEISKIWARLRIADLSDQQAWQRDPYGELATAILNTALQYQLMSAYTAFVAVDSSYVTEGDHGTTVHQAVPVPEGVRYDTTVEN